MIFYCAIIVYWQGRGHLRTAAVAIINSVRLMVTRQQGVHKETVGIKKARNLEKEFNESEQTIYTRLYSYADYNRQVKRGGIRHIAMTSHSLTLRASDKS